MTMPVTAAVIQKLGVESINSLTDQQLDEAIQALRVDLPDAVDFIDEACRSGAQKSGFAYLSKSPEDMASKREWNRVVGYLARLFASPYGGIVKEWTQRCYGLDVAFVNCCIIATEPDGIDPSKLFWLQTNQQLTPDC